MPQNRTKIDVIDMPMGTGKTNGMIAYMNSHPENKYLFVTPYRTERERIQMYCADLGFVIPDNEYSKLTECHKFIMDGKNIATTHALFSLFNADTMELLRQKNYCLIIDEEPDCAFDIFTLSTSDFQLLRGSYISVDESSRNEVLLSDREYLGSIKTYNKMVDKKDSHRLFLVDDLNFDNRNIGVIGIMKPDIMECFTRIFLLTYLFNESFYECYCRFWGIPYQLCCFEGEELREQAFDDREFRNNARSLILLHGENERTRLNFRPYDADEHARAVTLSKSWYKNATAGRILRVKRNASNYIRNIVHSNQRETMWSTFKDWEDRIKGEGCYARSFVACNCRATNKYREKKTLAYLLNPYPNPFLIRWLSHNGINVRQEHFSLTMLLQWVFRSRIRDGKAINLYLPSARMRDILQDYYRISQ